MKTFLLSIALAAAAFAAEPKVLTLHQATAPAFLPPTVTTLFQPNVLVIVNEPESGTEAYRVSLRYNLRDGKIATQRQLIERAPDGRASVALFFVPADITDPVAIVEPLRLF